MEAETDGAPSVAIARVEHLVGQLVGAVDELQEIATELPEAPADVEAEEGEPPGSVLRGAIECTVADYLAPAIEALSGAVDELRKAIVPGQGSTEAP
jgi:hypothetical protein